MCSVDNQELMTGKEVVEHLRIETPNPRRTLAYYRDQGLLKGVRIGREYKYRRIDVKNFIHRKMRLGA